MTTLSISCSVAALIYLSSFYPLVRMYAGPSTLEETSALQNQSARKCFTSTLNWTKCPTLISQTKSMTLLNNN